MAWEDRRIFGTVEGLPPWLDGPQVRALAKRNGWTVEQAREALIAYGREPTNQKPEGEAEQ